MKLYLVEKISLTYIALTSVVILLFAGVIAHALPMLMVRALVVGFILFAAWLAGWTKGKQLSKILEIVRYFIHLVLLGYWYPETFEFNRYLPNLDYLFAYAEQWLFGCQPALLFSRICTSPTFNELMNFGYFSYFSMIVFTGILFYYTRRAVFDRVITIIISAFFIYYTIFIILPVAGPQYYFPAIKYVETEQALSPPSSTDFPALGTYFNTHESLQENPVEGNGLFRRCVVTCQKGEKPTGAFPSSHVGMATIMMLLFWRWHKRWLWLLAPVYILLVLSTVYLKAHYAIDAIAGVLSALLIWLVLKKLTDENKF